MNDTYKTRDLYVASYLIAKEHPLEECEQMKGYLLFVFNDTPILRERVSEWNAKRANVCATTYRDAIKHLKGICHS